MALRATDGNEDAMGWLCSGQPLHGGTYRSSGHPLPNGRGSDQLVGRRMEGPACGVGAIGRGANGLSVS